MRLTDNNHPVALVERFRPKFRQITWRPRGLALSSERLRGSWMTTDILGTNFYMDPMHIGQDKSMGSIMNAMPFINVEAAGLKFSADFDTALFAMEISFAEQFNSKLWQAIQDGPLKGRRFWADPVFKNGAMPVSIHDYSSTNLMITVEGGDVPGLDLAPSMLVFHDGWKVYIPPGPEREAIEAAIALEQANLQLEKSEPVTRVGEAQQALREKLMAIA